MFNPLSELTINTVNRPVTSYFTKWGISNIQKRNNDSFHTVCPNLPFLKNSVESVNKVLFTLSWQKKKS